MITSQEYRQRLAGIPIEWKYTFNRLGITPEDIK